MLLTTEKCISYSVGNCKLIVFCWCIYGSLCYIEHRPTAVLYSVLHSTSRGSQQHTVGPLSLASLHVVAKWTFCIFWSSKFMSVLSSLRPAYRSVPIIELFTFRVRCRCIRLSRDGFCMQRSNWNQLLSVSLFVSTSIHCGSDRIGISFSVSSRVSFFHLSFSEGRCVQQTGWDALCCDVALPCDAARDAVHNAPNPSGVNEPQQRFKIHVRTTDVTCVSTRHRNCHCR